MRAYLAEGLASLPGVKPDDALTDRLLQYLNELQHWNRAYNLTAVSDGIDMVSVHLLDCLAIIPWVSDGAEPVAVLDVGSGAGLPGIPLAIARPDWSLTLIDSAGKKVRFLRHVTRQLGLANVNPVESRLENYSAPGKFDVIVSRAFASLGTYVRSIRHLASPKARLLAMKGKYPDSELPELPAWVTVDAIEKLEVPGLQAERHIVIMRVKSDDAQGM